MNICVSLLFTMAGSGPTRQYEARDSELPQASRRGLCKVFAFKLTNRCSFLSGAGRVTVRAELFEWDQRIPTGKCSFRNSSCGGSNKAVKIGHKRKFEVRTLPASLCLVCRLLGCAETAENKPSGATAGSFFESRQCASTLRSINRR
jgi:hypothetical protein